MDIGASPRTNDRSTCWILPYAFDKIVPETFKRILVRRIVTLHPLHVDHHGLSSSSISRRARQEQKGPRRAGGLKMIFLGARLTLGSIKSIIEWKSMANIASQCISQR